MSKNIDRDWINTENDTDIEHRADLTIDPENDTRLSETQSACQKRDTMFSKNIQRFPKRPRQTSDTTSCALQGATRRPGGRGGVVDVSPTRIPTMRNSNCALAVLSLLMAVVSVWLGATKNKTEKSSSNPVEVEEFTPKKGTKIMVI